MNILLIVADDLGFSDLGSFGGEIATPHLDALAMRGVRFTNFHSAPACSPTRAMVLTGVDPHIAGIGTMLEVAAPGFAGAPGYEGHLNERVVTVSELLQAAGWHTILSGKWHLGDTRTSTPDARGFTRSFALLPAGSSHYAGDGVNRFSTVKADYREDGKAVESLPEDFYSSDYYATRLIGYLEERPRDRPFFAYLPFTAPHWPLHVPREEIVAYAGRYDGGPEVLRAERLAKMQAMGLLAEGVEPHPFEGGEDWASLTSAERAWSARTMEVYAGMVTRMDRNIGRVVEALRQMGDLDDTLVLFLSDNGAEGAMVEAMPIVGDLIAEQIAEHYDNSIDNLGEPDSCCWYGPRWAQAATAPCRLHKAFTTQGGIRVPFFASGPRIGNGPGIANGSDTEAGGHISHAFATAMDIPATILDLAGIAHPPQWKGRSVAPLEGRSMVPHLRVGSPAIHPSDTETGWELFGRRAIRRGDWKAVWLREPEGAGQWQLYDLARDPAECHDRAALEPEVLASLIEAWNHYASAKGIVEGPVSIFEMDQE